MASTRTAWTRPTAEGGDASVQIALEIRRHLVRSDLQPGDRLGTEQELASGFGVSRPTLREALRLLSSSHLIRASRGPRGGIFVASTPNESMGRNLSESISTLLETQSVSLGELVEARVQLEVPLAGLAARNVTPEVVIRLSEAIDEQEGKHPASDEFRLADARFHRTIASAAGNELLQAFASWTLDVLQPSLIEKIGDSIDGDTIIRQHRTVLRAIRRGQERASSRAMSRHLEYLRELVRRFEECPDNRRGRVGKVGATPSMIAPQILSDE